MLKPQKWTIPSQSGDIEVQFTPHNFSGRHELYIGGNKIKYRAASKYCARPAVLWKSRFRWILPNTVL